MKNDTKAHARAVKRAKERITNYRVLDSAPCERCFKDCREELDGWVISGLCLNCQESKR
jgi:hypothetical protein